MEEERKMGIERYNQLIEGCKREEEKCESRAEKWEENPIEDRDFCWKQARFWRRQIGFWRREEVELHMQISSIDALNGIIAAQL